MVSKPSLALLVFSLSLKVTEWTWDFGQSSFQRKAFISQQLEWDHCMFVACLSMTLTWQEGVICVVSTLPSLLCWEHVSPGSADQDQGMPRSAEAAIAQSCKCSARYSLEEVGQGTKQTETRTSSPDASPEQRDSILTNGLHSQSIPTDRKSAFQLRPAPGGGLWPRLLGAIHNESDP